MNIKTKLNIFCDGIVLAIFIFFFAILIFLCIGAAAAITAIMSNPPGTTPATPATDVSLMERLQAVLPATQVDSVQESVIPDLYEVVAGQQVLYLSQDRYLVIGHIYDLQEARDLTAERKASLPAIEAAEITSSAPVAADIQSTFETLKHLAVEYGRADAPQIYVFSDPQCGYCQRLHNELIDRDDVRVFELMYPIFPGSAERAAAVLCSADRVAALTSVMRGSQIEADPACIEQIMPELSRSVALGRSFNVQGTPTLFSSSGRRQVGFLPAADLLVWLNQEPSS